MTPEQFEALRTYIQNTIDWKIRNSQGQAGFEEDLLYELFEESESKLRKLLVMEDGK